MRSILGRKLETKTAFDEEGRRLPLTFVAVGGCRITTIRLDAKDGYCALQLGIGEKKSRKKGAKKMAPLYLKEVMVDSKEAVDFKVGQEIQAGEIFKAGDLVNVIGRTKGKGFAGGVKRWHFKGGPRTHGQSDRERAPGSIGMTTTPGRVFKGKHMAGRMGGVQRTIKNLTVMGIDEEQKILTIKGLAPGAKNGWLIIEKHHA